jgi:DivIVA domain-containing protein
MTMRRQAYEAVGVSSIRDTFLGVRRPPLTWGEAHGKRFATHRRGYDVEQVDASLIRLN